MSLHTNRRSHYGFAYFIFCYQTVQYDVIAFTHITNIHGGFCPPGNGGTEGG